MGNTEYLGIKPARTDMRSGAAELEVPKGRSFLLLLFFLFLFLLYFEVIFLICESPIPAIILGMPSPYSDGSSPCLCRLSFDEAGADAWHEADGILSLWCRTRSSASDHAPRAIPVTGLVGK